MALTAKSLSPSPASPEARGIRVRHVRETVLRYTRRKFGEKYAIPAPTIQNWEQGKYGGLTEKGALKLLEAFRSEGVPCSVEWLLYGFGIQPEDSWQPKPLSVSANQVIAQELALFRQLHPNAVDAIVADDSMAPGLQMGDIVAGERYFGEEIPQAIGQYCIVQLVSGEVLIRELLSGEQGQYILTCVNPQAKTKAKKIKTDLLFSVAPIIWIRRKAGILGR